MRAFKTSNLAFTEVGGWEVELIQVANSTCQVFACHLEITFFVKFLKGLTWLRSFPEKLSSCVLISFPPTAAMMALMCLWSVRVATCKIQSKGILAAIIVVPCPRGECPRQRRREALGRQRRRWCQADWPRLGWSGWAGGQREGGLIRIVDATCDLCCYITSIVGYHLNHDLCLLWFMAQRHSWDWWTTCEYHRIEESPE